MLAFSVAQAAGRPLLNDRREPPGPRQKLADFGERWEDDAPMRRPDLSNPSLVPTLLGGLSLMMFAGLTFLACAGANRRELDKYWVSEPGTEGELQDPEALTDEKPAAADAGLSALPGVRHDLSLAPSAQRQARCSCLAVESGTASEGKFRWQNGAPTLSPNDTVVAISARGVECPGGPSDESARRVSISAVDRDGNDVVVEVEELPEGRPLASGAIVPQPGPGGALFVRSKNGRLPYARPSAGQRACKVR
jgi:hypothetical protein